MTKIEIIFKDIDERKEFTHQGHTLAMIKDYGNHIYLYQRTGKKDPTWGEGIAHKGYELVVAKPKKNPDGSIVYAYPSSSDWGKYGFSYISTESKAFKSKLAELMEKYK